MIVYVKQRKISKNDFLNYMIFLPLVAAIHFAIYSFVLFVDHLDGIVQYPQIYNIWSLFIFSQVLVTKLLLAIMALIRLNKAVLK